MIKFLFDRFISLLGIIILFPFLVIIALIIIIDMGSYKPIFTQKRVGYKGKIFTLYKFRTMKNEEEEDDIFPANPQRITKFGSFLRKYKIDELPELWNVFIGDMSFVGPRPDIPGYADRLTGNDRLILNLRPGITCMASIKYANEEYLLSRAENPRKYNDEIIYPDKVKINLEYYYDHTFAGDIKIIIKTIFRSYQ